MERKHWITEPLKHANWILSSPPFLFLLTLFVPFPQSSSNPLPPGLDKEQVRELGKHVGQWLRKEDESMRKRFSWRQHSPFSSRTPSPDFQVPTLSPLTYVSLSIPATPVLWLSLSASAAVKLQLITLRLTDQLPSQTFNTLRPTHLFPNSISQYFSSFSVCHSRLLFSSRALPLLSLHCSPYSLLNVPYPSLVSSCLSRYHLSFQTNMK